jgi:hypothetical protein
MERSILMFWVILTGMDFDGDGRIAFSDFLRFIGLFGKTPTGG